MYKDNALLLWYKVATVDILSFPGTTVIQYRADVGFSTCIFHKLLVTGLLLLLLLLLRYYCLFYITLCKGANISINDSENPLNTTSNPSDLPIARPTICADVNCIVLVSTGSPALLVPSFVFCKGIVTSPGIIIRNSIYLLSLKGWTIKSDAYTKLLTLARSWRTLQTNSSKNLCVRWQNLKKRNISYGNLIFKVENNRNTSIHVLGNKEIKAEGNLTIVPEILGSESWRP